jgi:hypothetical protein
MDISLLFTAIAFERGLFGPQFKNLEDLHKGEAFVIPKMNKVERLPVFLKSTARETLIEDQGMREHALNDRLRKTCDDLGLYARFTMYSLRRTAIIETRRSEGTEAAK